VTTLRILVVDDNEDLADSIVSALTDLGHAVRVAYSPFIAVTTAEEFLPDVAFLDLGLPGMDGYELARALLHKPDLASLRLVAMTGLEGQGTRCLELGFKSHLFKPFSLDLLEKVLAELG
jgi:CheY-like chemotaxis protein